MDKLGLRVLFAVDSWRRSAAVFRVKSLGAESHERQKRYIRKQQKENRYLPYNSQLDSRVKKRKEEVCARDKATNQSSQECVRFLSLSLGMKWIRRSACLLKEDSSAELYTHSRETFHLPVPFFFHCSTSLLITSSSVVSSTSSGGSICCGVTALNSDTTRPSSSLLSCTIPYSTGIETKLFPNIV